MHLPCKEPSAHVSYMKSNAAFARVVCCSASLRLLRSRSTLIHEPLRVRGTLIDELQRSGKLLHTSCCKNSSAAHLLSRLEAW